MPGTKPETPPKGQAPPIHGSMKSLLTSVRRGQTVEVRTETMLRGLIQQAHVAQKAGPPSFADWEQRVTNAIPEYYSAIAGLIGSAEQKPASAGAGGE